MKQIFAVSSLFQLAGLHAALTSRVLDHQPSERILIVSDNRVVNDFGMPFHLTDTAAPLLSTFDRIVDYTDQVWPMHPTQWVPKADECPMIARLLRTQWGLGDEPVELFVESVQAAPATALMAIFADADIYVHADGLMSYGPTRRVLPNTVAQRLRGLIMVDLVGELHPLLLHEFAVPLLTVPSAALGTTFDLMSTAPSCSCLADFDSHGAPRALIAGQYLSDIGLLDVSAELELYESMLRTASARGIHSVFFKPHPAASTSVAPALASYATKMGMEVEVLPAVLPVELCLHRLRPQVMISCFSTAMATARRLYGTDVVAVGTRLALEHFAPYENSNRIPVTICDALFSTARDDGSRASSSDETDWEGSDPADLRDHAALPKPFPDPAHGALQRLVNAVAYCMQPVTAADLRSEAQQFLADTLPAHGRYFKRRRLTKLDLPGRLPPTGTSPLGRAWRRGRRAALGVGEQALPRTTAAARSLKRKIVAEKL